MKKKLSDTVNAIKKMATTATDKVAHRANQITLDVREMGNSLSETGSEQFERNINKVFPKVGAPAYIVHHSNVADDFTVHFDLTDVLDKLNEGVLARPSITLYSGRSDIDRDRLSESVMKAFEQEMSLHAQQAEEAAILSAREHRDALDKSLGTITENAVAVGFGGVVAVLLTGPLGVLALLLLGTFGHAENALSEATSIPYRLVKAGLESVSQPFTEKSQEAAAKNDRSTIHKAIANLELHMHTELIVLAGSYDNVAYPFRGPRISGDLPELLALEIRSNAIGGKYRSS